MPSHRVIFCALPPPWFATGPGGPKAAFAAFSSPSRHRMAVALAMSDAATVTWMRCIGASKTHFDPRGDGNTGLCARCPGADFDHPDMTHKSIQYERRA